MNRPYAQSSDENKAVILQALRPYFRGRVLEVASGTGQHAVYFCSQMPELSWQTSDLAENLDGIRAWIAASGLSLPPPISLDALGTWPDSRYDTLYTANSFHIMGKKAVARCLEAGAECLLPGGHFTVYGPFNYAGSYTSESNARFDAMLKSRDPKSGIRDFEWLDELAQAAGMIIEADIAMPANNHCLVWKKGTF